MKNNGDFVFHTKSSFILINKLLNPLNVKQKVDKSTKFKYYFSVFKSRGAYMENRYEIFTTLVGSVNRSIRRIKGEAIKNYNLKSHHVSCLYYLYKEEALTPTELIELCDEDKAAISRSLDYLETNGFLIKGKNKNRYNCKIVLTEKGIEVGKHISERIESILSEIDQCILPEDRNTFYQVLQIIEKSLRTF